MEHYTAYHVRFFRFRVPELPRKLGDRTHQLDVLHRKSTRTVAVAGLQGSPAPSPATPPEAGAFWSGTGPGVG